ncbi:MAG: hypothetical protein QN204_04930 [Armatimonadota bacterium]|nr:hypothetical protein [Armatimonadota bacterium]
MAWEFLRGTAQEIVRRPHVALTPLGDIESIAHGLEAGAHGRIGEAAVGVGLGAVGLLGVPSIRRIKRAELGALPRALPAIGDPRTGEILIGPSHPAITMAAVEHRPALAEAIVRGEAIDGFVDQATGELLPRSQALPLLREMGAQRALSEEVPRFESVPTGVLHPPTAEVDDAIIQATREFGGATFDPLTGENLYGEPFAVVGALPGNAMIVSPASSFARPHLTEFRSKFRPQLRPGRSIGTWRETLGSGEERIVMDPGRLFPSSEEGLRHAVLAGAENKQKAIFDLLHGKEYNVDEFLAANPGLERRAAQSRARVGGRRASDTPDFAAIRQGYEAVEKDLVQRYGAEGGAAVSAVRHRALKELDPLHPGGVFPAPREIDAQALARHAARVGTRAGVRGRAALRTPTSRERVLSEIMSYLPPERAELLRRGNRALKEDVIRSYARGTPPDVLAHAALAGREAMGWYRASRHSIRHTFGSDADRFTAVLASSSPLIAVPQNVDIALGAWEEWLRLGRTTDPEAIRRIAARYKYVNDFSPNLVTALTSPERALADLRPSTPLLSGPKVEPFRLNLLGRLERATIDVHSGRTLGTNKPGTKARNLAGEALHGAAAKTLQEWLGTPVSTANVQEMSWAFTRGLAEEKAKPHEVIEKLYRDGLLPSGKSLEAVIRDSDSIDLLLHRNAERVTRMGYPAPPPPLAERGLPGPVVEPDPLALTEVLERYRRAARGRALYGVAGAGLGAGAVLAGGQEEEVPR